MTLTDKLAHTTTCLRVARAFRHLGPCNTATFVVDLYDGPVVVDLRDPVVPLEQIDEVFRG